MRSFSGVFVGFYMVTAFATELRNKMSINSSHLNIKHLQSMTLLRSSVISGSAFMTLFPLNEVLAKDGEYGILEGRSFALIHPSIMTGLLLTTLYSGSLGLQWRRLRGINDKLRALSKELPELRSAGAKTTLPLAEVASALRLKLATEENGAARQALEEDIALLSSPSSKEMDTLFNELSGTRKKLQSANLKDRHFVTGSILLGAGTVNALYGAINSYLGSGELYPDSHLFFGAAITALWAMAAALVPQMQRGSEFARAAHIALNTLNVLLFTSQAVTGFDILGQVWATTSWP